MKYLYLLSSLAIAQGAMAQHITDAAPTPASYRVAAGVLGSFQTVGLLGELRRPGRFALKLAAVCNRDGAIPGEYGAAGIGLLSYYLPSRVAWLEPVVGLGGVYSGYHWQQRGQAGTVTDLNVGGAFGANLRFHPRWRTGLNLFAANGFRAEYRDGTMRKTGRRLLALPALTLEVLL